MSFVFFYIYNISEYCPKGRNSKPLGGFRSEQNTRQWAPTSDGVNTWVMLSNFSNNNGHVAIVIDDTSVSISDDPICFHDAMKTAPASAMASNAVAPIVVVCCDPVTGAATRPNCQENYGFEQAQAHCSNYGSGLRLCTYREVQRFKNPGKYFKRRCEQM